MHEPATGSRAGLWEEAASLPCQLNPILCVLYCMSHCMKLGGPVHVCALAWNLLVSADAPASAGRPPWLFAGHIQRPLGALPDPPSACLAPGLQGTCVALRVGESTCKILCPCQAVGQAHFGGLHQCMQYRMLSTDSALEVTELQSAGEPRYLVAALWVRLCGLCRVQKADSPSRAPNLATSSGGNLS